MSFSTLPLKCLYKVIVPRQMYTFHFYLYFLNVRVRQCSRNYDSELAAGWLPAIFDYLYGALNFRSRRTFIKVNYQPRVNSCSSFFI